MCTVAGFAVVDTAAVNDDEFWRATAVMRLGVEYACVQRSAVTLHSVLEALLLLVSVLLLQRQSNIKVT